MHHDDVREIVEELRSHIEEKTEGVETTIAAVDAVLAALGSPEDLASQYVTDDLLARAEVSRSPWGTLESLFCWASLSVVGFLALLISILGYFLGGVFILTGMLKLIHPQTAGLWLLPGGPGDVELSLRLGFGSPPVGGRDLLGWWILPLGLAVGCGMILLTTRVALWFAKWYRRSSRFVVRDLAI
jgi:hypothetical protein